MARKKRGAKNAAAARKAKAQKQQQQPQVENIINEETSTQSPTPTQTESEESCGSGTPKSCNTPVEVDKTSSSTSLPIPHKKFGKFRCLLAEEASKTELSSSESEMQIDPLELDPNNVEIITIDPDNLIDDLKSVEITDSETADDIAICSEEIVQEEIIEDVSDNIIEIISTSCDVQIETEIPIESETEIKTDFEDLVPLSDESQEPNIILTTQESSSSDTIIKSSEEIEFIPQDIEFTVLEPESTLQDIECEKEDQIQEIEVPEIDPKAQDSENIQKKSNNDTESNSDSSTSTTATVRRSSRIKSISVLKQRSKGHGLVKSDKSDRKEKIYKPSKNVPSDLEIISENSNSNTASSEKNVTPADSPTFATPSIGAEGDQKPVKVKSRWRRSSELEMGGSSPLTVSSHSQPSPQISSESESQNSSQNQGQKEKDESPVYDEEMEGRLRQFQQLQENQYLTERTTCKEAKKMVCDCFLTKEEIERGELGCGEDCLNRLLMIECGSQCVVGDRCTNKRFQKSQYAPCEVFRTEKKGFGIRATGNISYGEFILEYVGEVLDPDEFDKRATEYSQDKNRHYYFMALRADAVIDATQKGNISRFINHSCDPNAETQKWTVNGELRIGFFSKRTILANEEITFDYQFQRYGKEAQKCFCEATNCRGWIGEEPEDEEDEDEEEEEEESEQEEDNEEEVKDSPEKKEPKPKTQIIRKKRQLKKARKDIFEDLDLDDEIGVLSATGVKNQAHTLKLSRLMVRAKDVIPRMQLLKLLRDGELPCRRLFLDYHGLRLMHGWMCDASSMIDSENTNDSFKIEILKTLSSLPIPNKTMLQDSKVFSTVEKWSVGIKTELTSPVDDSDSNSPQIDTVSELVPKEPSKLADVEPMEVIESINFTEDIRIDLSKPGKTVIQPPEVKETIETESIEMQITEETIKEEIDEEKEAIEVKIETQEKIEDTTDTIVKSEDISDTIVKSEDTSDTIVQTEEKPEEKELEKLITEITSKLLLDWSVLKEVFRIPKKERIEQMKEHEREADRDYKEGLGLESENRGRNVVRYYKGGRYRIIEKDRRKSKEISEKGLRIEDRNLTSLPRLSKHERRQLFALQVAQEEEGRRRKHEQEMWRLHEQRCMVIGSDPRLTNMDMNQYPVFWNPNTNQWQPYTSAPNQPPNPQGMPPNPQGMPPNSQGMLHPQGMPPNSQGMPHPQGMPPNSQGMPHPPGMPPNPQGMPHLQGMPPNSQGMLHPQGMPPPQGMPTQMFDTRPPLCPNPPPQHMPMMMPPLPGATRPPLIPTYQPPPSSGKEEVAFAGPIPPPVKLPPKWKCAKDKYGRPYYYHIKIRMSQWEPPEFPPPVDETATEFADETSSSSETSSLSSDSDSDSDEDSEIGDTKLLLEIRHKLKHIETNPPDKISSPSASAEVKIDSPDVEVPEETKSVEITPKKKRVGLVQEIIISPRREEDKIASKIEMKKYKDTKEKLKRQKQVILEQTKKKLKSKVDRASSSKSSKKRRSSKSSKFKSLSSIDMNSENARKIKETFRSSMAGIMVQNLNSYRKPDCKLGRITNTEDFKHLARKLTHFVMLKELKHCQSIDELTCNESVKAKARDFVKKYMAKFGEIYFRPKDEADYNY